MVKYRQAKVTTWCVMWMLGQILYNKGLKGLLIANAEKTVDEAMSRMHDAYDWLPKAVRVPFIRRNMHMLQVMHKGRVVGITSGRGKETKPAMGTSPDRYVFTEFGEWENADAAMGHIMPSFRKRPNARGWNEGTPGEHMCRQHRMWLAAMEGKGMYHPTFLRWWEDDTCVLPPDQVKRFDGWKPGNDDIAYVESVLATNKANERLGVGDATEPSLEHLKFRRDILESEFSGKEWLFTNKYPPNPHAGFVSSLTPKLPKDAIERQLTEAVASTSPSLTRTATVAQVTRRESWFSMRTRSPRSPRFRLEKTLPVLLTAASTSRASSTMRCWSSRATRPPASLQLWPTATQTSGVTAMTTPASTRRRCGRSRLRATSSRGCSRTCLPSERCRHCTKR